MAEIARAVLLGDEATALVRLLREGDVVRLELTDMSIPPGAPDARLYVSPRVDGTVDDSASDLGKISDGLTELIVELPAYIDPSSVKSVAVYCKAYSVLFGFGALEHA